MTLGHILAPETPDKGKVAGDQLHQTGALLKYCIVNPRKS